MLCSVYYMYVAFIQRRHLSGANLGEDVGDIYHPPFRDDLPLSNRRDNDLLLLMSLPYRISDQWSPIRSSFESAYYSKSSNLPITVLGLAFQQNIIIKRITECIDTDCGCLICGVCLIQVSLCQQLMICSSYARLVCRELINTQQTHIGYK